MNSRWDESKICSADLTGPLGTPQPQAQTRHYDLHATRYEREAILIAVDGFHPNDAGYKVIADQLRALGYAPLH